MAIFAGRAETFAGHRVIKVPELVERDMNDA
jgi:hypothetical protein